MGTLKHTFFFFLLVTQICFAQWYQQNSGTGFSLHSVHFEDANNGWAVGGSIQTPPGGGIILRTTNGGINWITQIEVIGIALESVCFTDTNNGWAVGPYTILGTTDGGQNWISQLSGMEYWYLTGVSFTDANNGTAVGFDFEIGSENRIILRTTDGGENWISQTSGTANFLNGVFFTDVNNGWAVGDAGTILRTTNGGENWISQTSGTANYLRGVFFTDINNGWAVGDAGTILKTTDGGNNWSIQSSGTENVYNSVCFIDANTGWVVGGDYINSTILRTTDGGQNWVSQLSETTLQLYGVFFTDANNGTAVGDGGIILHTNNGGVTFIEEEEIVGTPADFLLSQNYPNPFNPSTKIKYSIPSVTLRQAQSDIRVTLKVYDVLGNEIETLVNEEKPAGTYEIMWYAEQLPSGVYFYQLKAGDYINTKKMILLK